MMTSEAKKPLLGPRLEVGYFSLMKKKIAKMRLVHYKARVGEAATTIHHHLELLANPKQNYTKKPELFVAPMHTVSFDWFLSGLEWILNSEFYLPEIIMEYQI